ncbi:MAG: thermonuclease family protein [Solirubrobacterales bacterium]
MSGDGEENGREERDGRTNRQEERSGAERQRGERGDRRRDGDRDGTGDGTEREPGDGGGGSPRGGVVVPVVDVVDGDTIEVLLDGEEEDVRYIGVDTPESVAPGEPVECFAKRASEFNAELVAGERVRLVFDAERRDVYGRLLAYVYVGERFVNAALVRRGYARTLTIEPNDAFAGLFDRLEQAAGNAGHGLWGACGP